MLKKLANKFMEKSLKERFLLAIGVLLFLIYLFFGLIIIFWKELPLNMAPNYRLALGIVLIVYSFLRFFRFFNKD
jgi:hypothetical protein|nr:hypothetical protein [uncultured Flavobacterium sp.]